MNRFKIPGEEQNVCVVCGGPISIYSTDDVCSIECQDVMDAMREHSQLWQMDEVDQNER